MPGSARPLSVPPPDARVVPITLTDVTRAEEYERLISFLPGRVQPTAQKLIREADEFVLRAGQPLQVKIDNVRLSYGARVTQDDLNACENLLGGFKANGRKGIPDTLHRVSKADNDLKILDKIFFRLGRLLRGGAEPFRDLIQGGGGIGLCGLPAAGKTTLLRDMILIDGEMHGTAVNVIDTSNEITGEGDEPHPAFADIVCNKVGSPENLVNVLRTSIRSQSAGRLYADEIGYEAGDVRMVMQADRFGPSITSSVHGDRLANVLENDVLYDLFGVRESATGQLRIYRAPAFRHFIEVRARGYYVLHRDLAQSVDAILSGRDAPVEHIVTRTRT